MQTTKKIAPMTFEALLTATILLTAALILLGQPNALYAGKLTNPKIVSFHWTTRVCVGTLGEGGPTMMYGSDDPSERVLVLKIQADVSAGGAKVSATSFKLLLKDSGGNESAHACDLVAEANSPDPGLFGSFLYEKIGFRVPIKLPKGRPHFSLASLLPPTIESVQLSQDGVAIGNPVSIGLERRYSVCVTCDEDIAPPANLAQTLGEHGYQVIVSRKRPPEMPGTTLGVNLPGATLVFTGTTVFYRKELETQGNEIFRLLAQLGLSPMGVTTVMASPFDIHVHIAS